jgi:hypothetical protein
MDDRKIPVSISQSPSLNVRFLPISNVLFIFLRVDVDGTSRSSKVVSGGIIMISEYFCSSRMEFSERIKKDFLIFIFLFSLFIFFSFLK